MFSLKGMLMEATRVYKSALYQFLAKAEALIDFSGLFGAAEQAVNAHVDSC